VLVTQLTGGQRATVLQLPVRRESTDRLHSVVSKPIGAI
jgi:hypothetical protein